MNSRGDPHVSAFFFSELFPHFFRVVWYLRSLYLVLLGSILIGGLVVAAIEDIPLGGAAYFAFVTGLTVGYGDLVPHTGFGKAISVLLGFVGIILTGLVVGGATHAVSKAWHE